jgi:hypothetical protein
MIATATACTDRQADPTEHRWGQRVTLELPVRLSVDGRAPGRGVLRNLSVSGALVETALELPVFTNLTVLLPAVCEVAPGTAGLAASVVRAAPGGFAVEWRDMACAPILELLERISGRPAASLCDDPAFTAGSEPC